MSTKRTRKQQQKAERRKKERADRVAARRARTTELAAGLSKPASWPLAEAYLSQDADDLGHALVIASRRYTDGRLAGFAATLDLRGDGLVALEVHDGSQPNALGQLLRDASTEQVLLVASPADALASLDEGIAARARAGHAPLPQAAAARALFPDVDPLDAERPLFIEDVADEDTVDQPKGGLFTPLLRLVGLA